MVAGHQITLSSWKKGGVFLAQRTILQVASDDILIYFRLANETRFEDNKFMDRRSMSLELDMFAGIRARSRSRNRYGFKEKKQ